MTPADLIAMREAAGFNQTELANLLGISRSTVSNAEAGRRNIGLPLCVRWAEVCGYRLAPVPRSWDAMLSVLNREDERILLRLAGVLPRLALQRKADLAALISHYIRSVSYFKEDETAEPWPPEGDDR